MFRSFKCLILMVCLVSGRSSTIFDGDNPRLADEIVLYAKSAEMRSYLNETNDPCKNFHNFACGSYYRNNPPDTLPYYKNVFQSLSKSMGRKLLTLLQAADDATDTATDRKVKRFYESCMHVGTLRSSYRAKLHGIISEFGQMPAVQGDEWQESEFDWLKTVGEIAHKYNVHMILGYFINVDPANNTVNRMRILPQDIPLQSAAIYTEDVHAPLRAIRKKTMAKKLKHFLGLEAKLAKLTAEEIFEFETRLFAPHNSTEGAPSKATEDSSALSTNLVTIEEMQRKYFPQLDIKRLINISLGSVPTDPVYDLLQDSAENIATALKQTPRRTVANYIFFYLLENFMFSTPQDNSLLEGWCVVTTKSHFSNILDNMVYRKYITNQTEQDVRNLWHTIKATFQDVLQSGQLTWMQEETRQYAVEKLETIRMEINAYQQTNFTEEFGQLTVNNRDYLENVKSILVLSAIRWRSKLNESPKPYDNPVLLSFTPVYIQAENLIKVPVSILQPYYLWSDSYPNALKFSTLGFLIAHELMHGFDENGRTYDKTGNSRQWWDKDTNEYFNNKTKCFSAQYHGYIYDSRQLPEVDSQAENTADNGGIRLAYNAYLRWYGDTVRSNDFESIPRLKYTSHQLFFIGYAQLWCSATHPLVRSFAASTDIHVPNEFRTIGPLSNLQEFSKEFNCPKGSGMNPKNKCIIYW